MRRVKYGGPLWLIKAFREFVELLIPKVPEGIAKDGIGGILLHYAPVRFGGAHF